MMKFKMPVFAVPVGAEYLGDVEFEARDPFEASDIFTREARKRYQEKLDKLPTLKPVESWSVDGDIQLVDFYRGSQNDPA